MNQFVSSYTPILEIVNDKNDNYLNEFEAERIRLKKKARNDKSVESNENCSKPPKKETELFNQNETSAIPKKNELIDGELLSIAPELEKADVNPQENSLDVLTKSSSNSKRQKTPKMKIVDGEIVIDEESLLIQTTPKERDEFEINKESVAPPKRRRCPAWSQTEDELFFKSIRLFGANFSMLAQVFPGRTRKDMKNKYKKEERLRPLKIDFALKNALPIGKRVLQQFQPQLKD